MPPHHDGLDLLEKARHLRPGHDLCEEAKREAAAVAQIGVQVAQQIDAGVVVLGLVRRPASGP